MTETILLENGYFYKGKAQANTLQSLIVEDGLIRAIGSHDELKSFLPSSCRRIDLQGQTVWPGLTDSHLHLELLAKRLVAVDCETETLAECLHRVQKAAKSPAK